MLCVAPLPACSAIPGLGGDSAKVSLESTPPGATASLSSSGFCTTPCTLSAPDKAGNYSVTFGLVGYAPSTVPFHVSTKQNWYSTEVTAIDPNPVTAVLQPTTPASQARKR
jgi:hypothetical protein